MPENRKRDSEKERNLLQDGLLNRLNCNKLQLSCNSLQLMCAPPGAHINCGWFKHPLFPFKEYLSWQGQDRKTLKRINALLKNICRSPL